MIKVPERVLALPEEFVQCRTFGHAWDTKRVVSDASGITIELVCARCATTRTDKVDRKGGEIIGRHYGYPANYCTKKGGEVSDRSTYRFEFVSRALGKR